MNSKTALCCSCSWVLIIHEDRGWKNLALHALHNEFAGFRFVSVSCAALNCVRRVSEFFREIATFISRLSSFDEFFSDTINHVSVTLLYI